MKNNKSKTKDLSIISNIMAESKFKLSKNDLVAYKVSLVETNLRNLIKSKEKEISVIKNKVSKEERNVKDEIAKIEVKLCEKAKTLRTSFKKLGIDISINVKIDKDPYYNPCNCNPDNLNPLLIINLDSNRMSQSRNELPPVKKTKIIKDAEKKIEKYENEMDKIVDVISQCHMKLSEIDRLERSTRALLIEKTLSKTPEGKKLLKMLQTADIDI